jgi:hypothetical protein
VVTPPVVTPPAAPGALDPRPIVVARTPGFEASNVGQRNAVRVFFSEPVSNVSRSTFQLRTGPVLGGGTPVAARSLSYDPITYSATFVPLTPLAPGTRYTAIVRNGIVDAAGQPLIASAWSFNTAPRPSVVQRTPAAGSTRVNRGSNIAARFSEAVSGLNAAQFGLRNSATGARTLAVVSYNPLTRVATLNPVGTLRPNTSYTATLATGIHDVDGNAINATSWTFRTGA